jgi:hypothetical protein
MTKLYKVIKDKGLPVDLVEYEGRNNMVSADVVLSFFFKDHKISLSSIIFFPAGYAMQV